VFPGEGASKLLGGVKRKGEKKTKGKKKPAFMFKL